MTAHHRLHAEPVVVDPRIDGFASASAEPHYAPELRLQPEHLVIHVDLVSAGPRAARVSVTHRVRANGLGARRLVLDGVGFEDLEVEGGLESWSYDGEHVELVWAQSFESNETREVTLRYLVREPRAGLYFLDASDEPGLSTMVYTDHETERARHWLATIDQPAVRTTIEIAIRAPAELTALATGKELGREEHGDGSATARFALEQRCPSYLLTWTVADFIRWDGGEVEGISLAAFAPRGRADDATTAKIIERSFGRIGEMIAWVPERVGVPFPYPKYHQYAAPFIGGAMENISLTSWDDRYLLDEELEPELRQLFDIVNLHELAHTWFGDFVVCRDYAHAWLKESWATYMESCWLEHSEGPDAGAHWRWHDAQSYFRESRDRYQRPIVLRRFDASFDMYDMHLYPGGARRLHMLRRLLGEETFWASVKEYVETFGDDTVETDDFRRVLERKSGRSLARFFDQWLRSPGHPKLEGSFQWDGEKKQGTFTLKQTQVDTKKGIPCFDLAPTLAWRIGETWHRQVAAFEGTQLQARFAMEAEPAEVVVDPDDDLLFELEFEVGDKRLETQLREGSYLGKLEAGRKIAKSGKRAKLDLLRAAYDTAHWTLREIWIDALGEAKNEAALELLLSLTVAHGETFDEKRIHKALFLALANYRDETIVPVLLDALGRTLPPRAREAAVDALARQAAIVGDEERASIVTALVAESEKTSYTAVGEGAALRALGLTRAPEALEPLVTYLLDRTKAARRRQHAATGIGVLARTLEDAPRQRALEVLRGVLVSDPNRKVRELAAGALMTAKDLGALDTLEAYRAGLPTQERAKLDRQLRPLRAGKGKLGDAEKRIADLETELRKLKERMAKLESGAN